MVDKCVLLNGDCLEKLKQLSDNSVDSLVTDPPAGISFMSKAWDEDKGGSKQWIAWMTEIMKECLRVLKPGAHGLVWAIPRTSHWTATALEDAGFEIRDVVTHLFGSGFPKSHNLEKATEDLRFKGWGTALKPASEHWILVRKPCSEKTVAANVLEYETGGINIDASRINPGELVPGGGNGKANHGGKYGAETNGERDIVQPHTNGRFPANLVLSHNEDCVDVCSKRCAVAELDKQSEESGGASRFFYCAKASKKDKGVGNTHPTVKSSSLMSYLIKMITPPDGIILDPFMGSGSTGVSAIKESFSFIGIEKETEYFEIATKRINKITDES